MTVFLFVYCGWVDKHLHASFDFAAFTYGNIAYNDSVGIVTLLDLGDLCTLTDNAACRNSKVGNSTICYCFDFRNFLLVEIILVLGFKTAEDICFCNVYLDFGLRDVIFKIFDSAFFAVILLADYVVSAAKFRLLCLSFINSFVFSYVQTFCLLVLSLFVNSFFIVIVVQLFCLVHCCSC